MLVARANESRLDRSYTTMNADQWVPTVATHSTRKRTVSAFDDGVWQLAIRRAVKNGEIDVGPVDVDAELVAGCVCCWCVLATERLENELVDQRRLAHSSSPDHKQLSHSMHKSRHAEACCTRGERNTPSEPSARKH